VALDLRDHATVRGGEIVVARHDRLDGHAGLLVQLDRVEQFEQPSR